MKLFISWSGELSRQVALVLRDWIPSVIQSVEPYVSSEDIDKGARWSSDIASELNESNYGIIVVTKENIKAPWINFESGALSKQIDQSKVSPFLYNLKKSELDGPLVQFQLTIFTKDDVKKLVESINKTLGTEALEQSRLDKVFDVWWEPLNESLSALSNFELAATEDIVVEQEENTYISEILEELLELSRNQQKILNSPASLLPPEYLREVNKIDRSERIHPGISRDLNLMVRKGRMLLEEEDVDKSSEIFNDELLSIFSEISQVARYLRKFGM
ncbi:MAG: hypothetical protein ABS942_11060 [Solibacillus sp.]